jgi:hypothetical protein
MEKKFLAPCKETSLVSSSKPWIDKKNIEVHVFLIVFIGCKDLVMLS